MSRGNCREVRQVRIVQADRHGETDRTAHRQTADHKQAKRTKQTTPPTPPVVGSETQNRKQPCNVKGHDTQLTNEKRECLYSAADRGRLMSGGGLPRFAPLRVRTVAEIGNGAQAEDGEQARQIGRQTDGGRSSRPQNGRFFRRVFADCPNTRRSCHARVSRRHEVENFSASGTKRGLSCHNGQNGTGSRRAAGSPVRRLWRGARPAKGCRGARACVCVPYG